MSAEIVALTLGIVASAPLLNQVVILAGISLLVTVAVYGIVAIIVKIDDLGFWLEEKSSLLAQKTGSALLFLAPLMMKVLSVVGTLAMFLVGGGIVVHGIPQLHALISQLTASAPALVSSFVTSLLAPMLIGAVIGSIVLLLVKLAGKLKGGKV